MTFDLYAEVEHAKFRDKIRNELNLDRLTDLKERFLEWAEANDFDGSFEKFIEINLDNIW